MLTHSYCCIFWRVRGVGFASSSLVKQLCVIRATHLALVFAKNWMLSVVLKCAAEEINSAGLNVLKRNKMKSSPPPVAKGTPKRHSSTACLRPTKIQKHKLPAPSDSTEAAERDGLDEVTQGCVTDVHHSSSTATCSEVFFPLHLGFFRGRAGRSMKQSVSSSLCH